MCIKAPSAPKTQVTDPLAGLKGAVAQDTYNSYSKNLPALMGVAGNLGNYDLNQPGVPDILKQASSAQSDLLKTATGGPDSGPFAALKNNLLGTFDTGVQKYTLDPLKEQLIQQGLYSSGSGRDSYANAANQAAQERALLGSQQDVNALNMEQNTINSSAGIGGQISNLLQLLGYSNPMGAIQQAQAGPQFQDIATNTYQPQQNDALSSIGKLLGQGLVSPVISSIPGGGMTAASPISSAIQAIPQLLGGQNPSTYNTGVNYNPSGGGGQNQLLQMLMGAGANQGIEALLPLLMAA